MRDLVVGASPVAEYLVGSRMNAFERERIFEAVADCERVFHLAPSRLTLTEHILDACAKYDRPLLLLSSAEVYGRTICGVAKESDPLVLSPATSPSIVATLFAERCAIERGIRVVIARLFDLAAPGTLFGRLLDDAENGRPLRIFGTGDQQRAFLHPEDAAAMLVRLMETPAAFGRPVNVGGTCAISLIDLARRLQQLTRPRPPIVRTPEAAYEEELIPCRLPCLTRLRSLIGPLQERTLDRLLLFFAHTIRALVAPRRCFPIAMIAVPMIVAQHRFSGQPAAISVSIAMAVIVFFLLVAPYGFRKLFPSHAKPSLLRLLAYGALGGVSPLIAYVIPHGLGIGTTFLADGVNNLVVACLFWVGGFGLARDIELEERWQHERRRAEDAQLLALENHLDPHFLFNTLNAIAEWCREDAEVAERAILQLSSILREILAGVKRPSWPLAKDLSLVEALFALHRIRDPSRFDAAITIPADLPPIEVPPMLLLPLAENAMKHGPGAGHRGKVELVVERRGELLAIVLINPGPYGGEREEGHGLATQKKRLALAYGDRARLEIGPLGERTRVELLLPCES